MELTAWGQHGVTAGITTRHHGFNLGLATPEPADRVLARWRHLLATFHPAFHTVHLGLQVHGAHVLLHRADAPGWTIHEATDGHVTHRPGVLLCVTVADCIPVFLLDPPSRVVGLLHAGWRGVAEGILERGIEVLSRTAGGSASDVVMHCGIGICGDCYQVGPEVIKALRGTAPAGATHLDLRRELEQRADRAGVREITVSGWCSAHHEDHFFSHRRSGGRDGRMVAYIGMSDA